MEILLTFIMVYLSIVFGIAITSIAIAYIYEKCQVWKWERTIKGYDPNKTY